MDTSDEQDEEVASAVTQQEDAMQQDTTDDDLPSACAPPREALRWIVRNAITSDTEIAILSNVCAEWRTWLVDCLVYDVSGGNDKALASEGGTTEEQDAVKSQRARPLLLSSMMRAYVTQQKTQTETTRQQNDREDVSNNDMFCVAWFASEGIQQVSWAQMVREDEILERMILEAQNSAASRDLTQELETNHSESEDERMPSKNNSSQTITPQNVALQATQQNAAASHIFQWQRKGRGVVLSNEWRGYREPLQVLRPFGYTPAFVQTIFSSLPQCPKPKNLRDASTEDKLCNAEYAQASFAVRGVTVARPESYCLCIDSPSNGANHDARLQRLRDRKDLRRTVFPRVLKKDGTPPFVQFLNIDKSSAVTLMTPALACGVLREPFTIFLVGIATEDGCFLSGLRRRFEIGHLYPRDQLADITDSSAVCVFAEDWSFPNERKQEKMEEDDEAMGDDGGSDESWDEDETLKDTAGCNCIFEGVTEKLSVLEDQDERHGRLIRGVLGPGAWHCYTIVVDGVDSVIRVDGVEEPMEIHQQSDSPALLDGLTLGSDHCFGTSLCCGQGSPGEGEGAMAEVAVFHGRMNTRDVDTLERHFMRKHGIEQPGINPWREDDLYRQARAMFQLVGNPRGTRVPLRYFTKSPNVAWKLNHPVSNQSIKRERIGARNDESSSDW